MALCELSPDAARRVNHLYFKPYPRVVPEPLSLTRAC
jgi:hypothetical protein